MKPILVIGKMNRDQGYTLLEMLAVVALIGLIFSLAVPSLINREERLLLNQIAKLLSSDLNKLKLEVVANRSDTTVYFTEAGYFFKLDDYQIERKFNNFSFHFIVLDVVDDEVDAEGDFETVPRDMMQLMVSSEGRCNPVRLEWESTHFKGVLAINEDLQVEWITTSK